MDFLSSFNIFSSSGFWDLTSRCLESWFTVSSKKKKKNELASQELNSHLGERRPYLHSGNASAHSTAKSKIDGYNGRKFRTELQFVPNQGCPSYSGASRKTENAFTQSPGRSASDQLLDDATGAQAFVFSRLTLQMVAISQSSMR